MTWELAITSLVAPARHSPAQNDRRDHPQPPTVHPILCLLAVLVLAFALPAWADRIGPVEVVGLPSFGAPEFGRYYESRFGVTNRSNDPHVVRIEVRAESLDMNQNSSRTRRSVHLAPRASVVVEVPQIITTSNTAGEAWVEVDGRERGMVRLHQESSWPGEKYVLASRSVPLDTAGSLHFHRTTLAPSEWSTSWLQYGRFELAVITAGDWAELPPAVRTALLRWTAAGGWLLFLGAPEEALPLLRPSADGSCSYHGVGRISVAAETPLAAELQTVLVAWLMERSRGAGVHQPPDLTLLKESFLPVRSLFGMLLAFVVIGGPLHLYLLAKKNRRVWVFWSLPLLSIVASGALVGATLLDEGWVRVHRSLALTLLDETRGEATTLGQSGIYATTAPRGEVVFDAETEIRPAGFVESADTETNEGQRLFGSWVGTRVPTYFSLRKSEPRRERLPVRHDARGPVALNGLGAHIERLWVAFPDGSVWTALNVPAGSEAVLARSSKVPTVRSGVTDIADRLAVVPAWPSVVAVAETDPAALLRPGTYIAVTRGGGFVPVSLEQPTASSARGVVIGLMKAAS